jgi:hypothetical protein
MRRFEEAAMRKLTLGLGAITLAATPVTLPTIAHSQSASDLPGLCREIVESGGGGYKSVGDCVSEIRGLPVDRCRFIKLYLGFPALVPDENGEPVLVENEGDCISHFRQHGGAR